ncbi:hypothetical protein [Plantactinospora sp. KLBMP9567]|uniref:hypothetical protein n=1 Tax=Plantactinospora sp. KLBMP9567 TaxID=3085900 RepID=UPI002981B927|nr:hypothetical protein [Plantactinospora sp. KLBMP9567]MDW5325750.1 hypothetical protein [Plantactinospora sp. KLBMP9567]
MAADGIVITGARENNLRNVSLLRVPERKLVVFTGASGSGKSSIVFDTIAAEAQRQLNETCTAFARNFLPRHGQPDVDTIESLSAAIVVDQKRLGGGSRSTVGTTHHRHLLAAAAPLLPGGKPHPHRPERSGRAGPGRASGGSEPPQLAPTSAGTVPRRTGCCRAPAAPSR